MIRQRLTSSSVRLLAAVVLLIKLCSLIVSGSTSVSQSVNLQSNERRCWTLYTPNEATHLSGNYEMLQLEDEVMSTKPLYIYLTAEGSKGPIYASPLGAGDGEFSVISKGRHELCIVNGINHNPIDGTRRRADGVERTIAFTVHLRPQHQSDHGPETLAVANSLNLAQKLGDNLQGLLDHFEYLKKQEQIHRDLATKTLGLLWKWTTLEAVVLIGIAVAQTHYLRRFFETKRYL